MEFRLYPFSSLKEMRGAVTPALYAANDGIYEQLHLRTAVRLGMSRTG